MRPPGVLWGCQRWVETGCSSWSCHPGGTAVGVGGSCRSHAPAPPPSPSSNPQQGCISCKVRCCMLRGERGETGKGAVQGWLWKAREGREGRGHRSDPALARANGIPALLKATAASLGLHKAMMQPEATTESMGRCPYPGSFLITVLAVRVQVPQVPAVGDPYTPTPQPSQVQLGGTLGPGALTHPVGYGLSAMLSSSVLAT